MKFNKKVSELARKLDYLGAEINKRREIIEICAHPLRFFTGGSYLTRKINESYERVKRIEAEISNRKIEQQRLLREHESLYKTTAEAEKALRERHLSYYN